MAKNSNIEWTDSTVNFWWGCTKVGPGCDHCYAETWSRRTGGNIWGGGVPRRKIKSAVALLHRLDNDYSRWAADHEIAGHHQTSRQRVFIQSMSDLFDLEVPLEWFSEAWQTIEQCSRLHIQIVTKRISAVEKRLAAIGVTTWPKHAGLIITVCNQAEADRDIPRLLALKMKLGIPWVGLSMEPLLGPVDLRQLHGFHNGATPQTCDALTGYSSDTPYGFVANKLPDPFSRGRVDWVIVGGESGPNARPMHPDWARSLRDQCKAADVPFFFKQIGEWAWSEDHFTDSPKWRRFARNETDPARVYVFPDGLNIARIGKASAGRLLDGREHNDMPRTLR